MTTGIEPKVPAFPQCIDSGSEIEYFVGLTKREYFAAIAMQGLLANDKWEHELAAENAVYLADALITALNK